MDRKKMFGILSLFGLMMMLSLSFVSAGKPAPTCPITSDTDIVLYTDTTGGIGSSSKSWGLHFVDWWKAQDPSISYVQLSKADVSTNCNLASYPNLKVYMQLGGDAYDQQRALGVTGKNNINNFINRADENHAYVGICAGMYYAVADYYWESSYYNHANLLGAYPLTIEGSIHSIAEYPNYAMTPVNDGNTVRDMIYYGGGTRGLEFTSSDILGTKNLFFSAIPNQLPASISYNRMLLNTVHAEAFENDGITGLSTAQRIENYKWLANRINEVANTNYYVPAYLIENNTQPPTNDTNTTVGTVFVDGFENGLSNWIIAGAGNLWTQKTTPFEGSYSAGVTKSGTVGTTMTASFVGNGSNAMTVKYVRKLVGLDAGDTFKSEYYSDGVWTAIETTHQENGGFVSKQFTVPATATQLKFTCIAGAVSESCYVDAVSITQ
jgi:hypothetical protein